MRRTALQSIYELARKDDRVIFIGSDLGPGTLDEYRRNIPERFLMEGISEANVIGIAAGLALNGKVPYVNTIASFLTRRCFEQIVTDLCLQNLNVRLLGNGGGLVYTPLGATHMAFEDLSIMRAIPNLTVISPCDAEEMKQLIPATMEHKGPVYIRLGKGGDPVVSCNDQKFEIGKGVVLKDGHEALIITTGIMAQFALQAAETLDKKRIPTGVLHLHTIKPLDKQRVLEMVATATAVVTVEENSVIGGLGSAVAETIAGADVKKMKQFAMIGIPDVFPDEYGSQTSLLERYSMTTGRLVTEISKGFD